MCADSPKILRVFKKNARVTSKEKWDPRPVAFGGKNMQSRFEECRSLGGVGWLHYNFKNVRHRKQNFLSCAEGAWDFSP